MSRSGFQTEDFINLMVVHGECRRVMKRTKIRYNERYPNRPRATLDIVRRLLNNCQQHGQFRPKKRKTAYVTRNEQKIITVLAYFYASPTASIRDAVRELNISNGSILKILHDYNWHPFHYTKVQHLYETDFQRRVNFCEWMLVQIQQDIEFPGKIIWCDEAKFTKNGCYNRHNSHFWSNHNPELTRETQFQHKWQFNVFCAIKDNNVFFFKFYDDNLTSELYLNILQQMVEAAVETMPVREAAEAWFQQDGAPPHNGRLIDNFLENEFDGKWLGNQGPYKWPPRSPDLTPLDYFIWGFVKDKVYFEPITTKENMVERVRNAFRSLQNDQIERATHHSLLQRIHKCLEVNGNVFEHIL